MTRREAAESQLRQAQKMEALGQLTGGIAHDFNNMLGVIMGALDLVKRRIAKGDFGIERFLDAATIASERAATLTQRLLAFARQQPLSPQPLDANKMIAAMSDLLHSTLGEHIQIETVTAAGLWTVHADSQQLENAILNIAHQRPRRHAGRRQAHDRNRQRLSRRSLLRGKIRKSSPDNSR